MTYRAILFNLFGTLTQSYSQEEAERALSAMAALLGAPQAEFVRLWGQAIYELETNMHSSLRAAMIHICHRKLSLFLDEDRMNRAAWCWRELTQRTLQALRPKVGETLAQLRNGNGCKIGVISNCGPEVPRLWTDTAFQRVPLVDIPVFSCQVGCTKPDKRLYLRACESLEVKPGECLYIGDGGTRELSGASEVGMHPVLLKIPSDESRYAAIHRDVEPWTGDTIETIEEALTLVNS